MRTLAWIVATSFSEEGKINEGEEDNKGGLTRRAAGIFRQNAAAASRAPRVNDAH